MKKLEQALIGYLQCDVFIFFLMGLSCAIPLALLGNTLTTWATDAQVNLKTIGLFALIMAPYSVKFLWAPFIERFSLPFLHVFGRKKTWGILAQIALLISILFMSFLNIQTQAVLLVHTGIAIAFFGATQDIVVDSLRIDTLQGDKLKQGSAMYQFGARIGLFTAGPVLIMLSQYQSWMICYQLGALLIIPGVVGLFFVEEKQDTDQIKPTIESIVLNPLTDFINRHKHWIAILSFIILYKICNAVLGKMAYPLYYQIGFDKTEVSLISGIIGPWITMFGVFIGGILMVKTSYYKLMMGLGWVEILTSVSFAILAMLGYNIPAFMLVTIFDNIVGGMGSAVFVAYLSSLCSKNYSATQYALLTSFMAISSYIIASCSGYLASFFGWSFFCLLTGVFMLPALILLRWIMKHDEKNC